MLKTYENETYSDGVTRGGDFVYDEKNDVYYDISTLTSAPSKIKDDPEFTKITYRQGGQLVEKYIATATWRSALLRKPSLIIQLGTAKTNWARLKRWLTRRATARLITTTPSARRKTKAGLTPARAGSPARKL